MAKLILDHQSTGKYFVTRDGSRALIYGNTLGDFTDIKPFKGVIFSKSGDVECSWDAYGRFYRNGFMTGDWDEDLIAQEKTYVTLTIPAPLKDVAVGQIIYYWERNNDYGVEGEPLCVLREGKYVYSGHHRSLLNMGQLFATQEDAHEFLEAMIGVRK